MKLFVLIACVCAASASSLSISPGDQQTMELEAPVNRIKFSEHSKTQLREAAILAIKELCLNENCDPLILTTICQKALTRQFKETTSGYSTASLYACMDCEVADPVCYDSCPQ